MEMPQEFFNIAVAVIGAFGGWWMKVMWESMKELQVADKELADKVGRIEVLVAGNYVKREDFERALNRVFDKLDAIELKIDGKMDRAGG